MPAAHTAGTVAGSEFRRVARARRRDPVAAVLGAVIVVGTILLRRDVRSRPKVGDSAVAVLGERYARGEINEDEYRQRLGVLREQQT